MARVVLIGGCGFIGHSLAIELRHRGHEVDIIDSLMINNLYAGHKGEHRSMLEERLHILEGIGVNLFRMDARDYSQLSHTLSVLKADVVVHLAAIAHMSVSAKDPNTTFDHNLRTLENTLDCVYETHVATGDKMAKVVYLSSSTVYGDWTAEKMGEDAKCDPKSIYGALKLAGEHIVRSHRHQKGIPYVIVRPSALYGPRCVSGRVIQTFIERAFVGMNLTASDESLDFTYIKDLIQGLTKCIESNVENETFNLTYGQGRKVIDAANIIAPHFEAVVNRSNKAPDGPNRGTLDISKAVEMLGYRPEYPIELGIPEYIKWYRQNVFNVEAGGQALRS